MRTSHNQHAFDLWAPSYETQINPLVMLEKRHLEGLLAEAPGGYVLDAGCGSGRWLTYLSTRKPHNLSGIDTSAAMLQIAARKNIAGVELFQCPCDETPFGDNRFDLIVSSFVLSYVEDVCSMAIEIDRIALKGCDFFLSDTHPETQARLNWKCSFKSSNGKIELDSVRHTLANIVEIFGSLGWELLETIEPEFVPPEREMFVAAGHLDYFLEANGFPAIYLLHLKKSNL